MSAWQSIRLMRARPPALAATDPERAAVFAAALEQSEQLMRAARDVGHAARPLPLFYSLSQAGRAIAAARLDDPAWRLAGHGLAALTDPGITDLLRRVIEPQPAGPKKIAEGRRDSFGGVAVAVGSEALTAPIELGEAWAAVPELIPQMPQMPSLHTEWRRPLVVFDEYWDADPHIQSMRDQFPLGMLVAGLPPDANAEKRCAELSRYPAVAGAVIRTDPHLGSVGTPAEIIRDYSPEGQECTRIVWLGPRANHPRLDEVAPVYRWTGVRLLIPRLSARDHLSPLMLWWVLLFGLSSIARYDPELWVAALDVNESQQAVPIEAALDEAMNALPDLILLALVG
jgi:hypothetical protein